MLTQHGSDQRFSFIKYRDAYWDFQQVCILSGTHVCICPGALLQFPLFSLSVPVRGLKFNPGRGTLKYPVSNPTEWCICTIGGTLLSFYLSWCFTAVSPIFSICPGKGSCKKNLKKFSGLAKALPLPPSNLVATFFGGFFFSQASKIVLSW